MTGKWPHVDELFVLAWGRTSALWSDWLTVFTF